MSDKAVVDVETFAAIIGQFGPLIAGQKWLLEPPAANTLRGVDFYNATDFVTTFILSVLDFKRAHGYMPDLAAPSRFNEHILARKFFAPLPLPSLADKLGVRDYVRQRLGEAALIPVAWTGEHIDDLFTADLPAGRFVLKATHGCAMNLFLDLPGDLTTRREEIREAANDWLATRFGYHTGEWQYCVVKRQLYLEAFLGPTGDKPMLEFKVHCFHGKARLLQVLADRFTDLRLGQYTRDWEPLSASMAYYKEAEFDRPKNLDVLIDHVERLAQGLEYARIDLYTDFDQVVKFGEITLTPGDGRQTFTSDDFERWLGGFFVLPAAD